MTCHFTRSGFARVAVVFLLALASNAGANSSSTLTRANDLSLQVQAVVSAALGKDDVQYHAITKDRTLYLNNLRHRISAEFTAEGIQVRSGDSNWGLAWQGYGDAEATTSVQTITTPVANANRVEYRRGAVTEWYVNGPRGLEQGFTLSAPPARQRPGEPLILRMAVSGNLDTRVDSGATQLILVQADGQPSLRYRGVTSWDATGRTLPASLHLKDRELSIQIQDKGAQYPIIVDPFVEQAKLIASDGASNDVFGTAVAISGDTLVVGAEGANGGKGSVYLFVKGASGWMTMTQTAKLTASDGVAGDEFGRSVAVSGDTVVVGAPTSTFNPGAAYVFVKPVSGWAGALSESAKLTASDRAAGDAFGTSVAASGDTVVIGAFGDDIGANGNQGSAYVFVKPVTGWAGALNQSAKLTAADGAGSDFFGVSVAIDGDAVVVGAMGNDNGVKFDQGAVYVFVKPVSGWAGALNQSAKLTASDGATVDRLGVSVAISGDSVVAGAIGDDIGAVFDHGSAYVFTKPAGGWAGALNQSAKLIASDGAFSDQLGGSVAVSGDTVVAGTPSKTIGANAGQGAAYVFVKPAGGWAGTLNENGKLTASDGTQSDQFGVAVAISSTTVLVGMNGDQVGSNNNQGSAYVFDTGTPPPPPPSSLAINGTTLSTGESGLPYNGDLQIVGGTAPYIVSITKGKVPAGLSISNTGIISGTPGASAKSSSMTVQVADQASAKVTKAFSIVIVKTLTMARARLRTGTVGNAYNGILKTSGGKAPYNWSTTGGTLPTGLSLDSATGAVVGTPTQAGAFNLTFQVTDTLGGVASISLTLTIK